MVSLLPLWAGAATIVSPGLRLLLHARVRRGKEIAARLPERRGIDPTPRPAGRLLWLHAASVGETVSVFPVLTALAEQAPDASVLLTTGTLTSARLLAQRLPELGLERRVLHRFAPLDVPRWVARFLDHWRPDAAAFVESELWPNFVAACRARGVPVMLLNARLSERSFARWRRVRGPARELLGGFARIEAQSEADAARLRALGARAVSVPGNLKFAAPPLPCDSAELERLREMLRGRPVWLAASTHPGEEAIVLGVHRALAAAHPGLLTIIAPRHPDRGGQVADEARQFFSSAGESSPPPTPSHKGRGNRKPPPLVGGGWGEGSLSQRSAGQDPPRGGIWLADTLGELGLLYRLSRIAFIGRSLLAPGGGQNPLEAARLGCAIAVGPHTGNFVDILQVLEGAGAVAHVPDAAALAAWVSDMLRDPDAREAAGRAGMAAAARYADLPARTAATLLDLMSAGARPAVA
ncbi:MAG: 3-deoxy-D-manno-octulosonic acid transferase [Alphaproteobacteria bacterium]|nr:3-deoxy-D-manno-octulosonic acid transferase [Alphaproteobacteria bacterium]